MWIKRAISRFLFGHIDDLIADRDAARRLLDVTARERDAAKIRASHAGLYREELIRLAIQCRTKGGDMAAVAQRIERFLAKRQKVER